MLAVALYDELLCDCFGVGGLIVLVDCGSLGWLFVGFGCCCVYLLGTWLVLLLFGTIAFWYRCWGGGFGAFVLLV